MSAGRKFKDRGQRFGLKASTSWRAEGNSNMNLIQMPDPSGDLASRIERLHGLLTVKQLVSLTGISRTTIYEYVTAGRIPHIRIGTMIRFDPHAIAA